MNQAPNDTTQSQAKDSTAQDINLSAEWTVAKRAIQYAEAGYTIFPIFEMRGNRCSCGNVECRSPGKHPRTAAGHNEATADPEQVKAWWNTWPEANIGYRPKDNEIVLDIEKEGLENGLLISLIKLFGPLPTTRMNNTGGGGQHHFFTLPEGAPEIKNRAKVFDGMDIRTVKGYVILPPSNHASGNKYEWEARAGERVQELPMEWCNGIATGQTTKEPTRNTLLHHKYAEGSRNNSMFNMASAARGKGKSESQILTEIRRENKRLCSPPLPDAELKKIAESVAKFKPGALDVADEEAEQIRIARLRNLVTGEVNNQKLDHMELLKACNEVNHIRKPKEQINCYAAYADGVYVTGPAAQNEMMATIKDVLGQCKEALGWDAQRLYNSRTNTEFWNQARIAAISTTVEEWDRDNYKLNVLNGVLDLITGELLPHSPDYLMTKQATVIFNKSKKCPWWDKVIERQLGTGDKARYFQAICGRLLTGDVSDKAFYLLYGPTDTGKSKILGTIASLLGTYAVRASRETFVESSFDNTRWEVANWVGARLVHVQEFKPEDYWHEPLLKDISGGDEISAAQKHMKPFTYQPKCKIVMATNHIPMSNTMDSSFEDRVRILPFENQIPKAEQDPNLSQRFLGEFSGILNYMLKGIDIIEEIGLGVPDWMEEHIDFYKVAEDPLSLFAENALTEAKNKKIQATYLFHRYEEYMRILDIDPLTQTAFGKAMKHKGHKTSMSAGKTYYVNVALRERDNWWKKDNQTDLGTIGE